MSALEPVLFGAPAIALRASDGLHRDSGGGGTDVWLTPPELLARLGRFDLDPCAAPEPRPWTTADRHLTATDDGLRQPWAGRVWVNPPYSDARRWIARLADHGTGTALLFARTDTAAFQQQVFARASAALFISGRLSFCRPDGSRGRAGRAGAPSVLIAYGQRDAQILAGLTNLGAFLVLR